MALEAGRIAEALETAPENRRATAERRGKDRRQSGARINKVAPRRSLMKLCGAVATGISLGLFAVIIIATSVLLDEPPWIALSVSGLAVVVSIFALLLGSLEERLIEIRLELMMANGGMRKADRRGGDRRGEISREAQSAHTSAAALPAQAPVTTLQSQ